MNRTWLVCRYKINDLVRGKCTCVVGLEEGKGWLG